MKSRILGEYFSVFRWGNMKEKLKESGVWILYMTIISPIVFRDPLLKSVQMGMVYYLTILSCLFAMLSTRLHPMTLPKLMYLAPMSEKERRNHIRRAYCLNIMIPVLVGALCQGILILAGWVNVIMAGMAVLETFLIALLFGMTGGSIWSGNERTNQKETIKEVRRWGLIAEIVTFFLLYLLPACVTMATEKWEQYMVIVSILLFQLPLVLMVMRGYPQAEEMAVNYEQIQK